MREIKIPYSEDLLATYGQSPDDLERELRFLLAVKLFELRRLSIGRAAELSRMNKIEFMGRPGRMKIPVINLDEDQIKDELRND